MSEITVIIPTWNQKDLLQTCLQSLQRQKVPCQVRVVDNGSKDSTEEMVRVHPTHLFLQPSIREPGFQPRLCRSCQRWDSLRFNRIRGSAQQRHRNRSRLG